jgi:hypothetical protein
MFTSVLICCDGEWKFKSQMVFLLTYVLLKFLPQHIIHCSDQLWYISTIFTIKYIKSLIFRVRPYVLDFLSTGLIRKNRPFRCNTLLVFKCFQRLRISCSFFTIFHQKRTCYCKVLEAPKIQKVSHSKALASKIIRKKFRSLISCHSWEIKWFLFNELTVHLLS